MDRRTIRRFLAALGLVLVALTLVVAAQAPARAAEYPVEVAGDQWLRDATQTMAGAVEAQGFSWQQAAQLMDTESSYGWEDDHLDVTYNPPSGAGLYRQGTIYVAAANVDILAHELGHAVDDLVLTEADKEALGAAWDIPVDCSGRTSACEGWDWGREYGTLGQETWAEAFMAAFLPTEPGDGYPHVPEDLESFRRYVVDLLAERTAPEPASSFPDVEPSSAHYETIHEAAALGIVVGYPDGTFRPEETVSQRQVYTMRERVDGRPRGSDSTSEGGTRGWVAEQLVGSMERAEELGIFQGYADGSLKPWRTITRAEAASVFIRYRGTLN